jgi:hypothetical protein
MATTTTKSNGKSDDAPKPKSDNPQDRNSAVVPASRTDTKEETRLFQRGPDEKVWLTESEAKAEGFYWRDEKKLGKA